MYSKSIPPPLPPVIIYTKTYMNYRLWKFSFHLLGLKFKLKQRKVSNSFLSMRFNYPYKRQGDLYSRVAGDSWVIQHKSYGIHSDCWQKPEIFCKVKINCRAQKKCHPLVKSSWLPAKITAYLVSIGQLLCLAFLYGWCFLNKMSLDWPLTLTTQPSTSKLSDNPDPVVQDN